MGSGSKSATTSSRHRHFNPGEEFFYHFEANRTFSRDGRRPVSSPARIIHSSNKKRGKAYPLPEDIVAMTQSPSPNLIQESFGGSLMMLKKGYHKVNPGKFLELKRLSDLPNSAELTSPRLGPPTPRLVKHIANRINGENNTIRNKSAKGISKGTQYDYRSKNANIPSSAYKVPSNVADVVVPFIKQAQRLHQSQGNDDLSQGRSFQQAFQQFEFYSDRCVRCSEFPEIQIEGRSLTRILTNTNTLMAKGHCEILGPDSCPDCVKIRSQKHNEEQCMKNTPASDNDVYKLALVHEKAPYLNIREVQRKILDGEISDKVLSVSRWPQVDNVAVINEDMADSVNEKNIQTNLPELSNSLTPNKKYKQGLKPSKSFMLSNVSAFPTIHESSEVLDHSEEENEKDIVTQTDISPLTDAKVVYRKKSAEKMRKIQLVPASEKPIMPSTSLDVINIVEDENSQNNVHEKNRSKPFDTQVAEKVDSLKVNESVSKMKIPSVRPMTVSAYKRSKQHCFTCNVVPSQDFFFDISDLNNRLRFAPTNVTRKKIEQHVPAAMSEDLSKDAKQSSVISAVENKAETSSVASTDSTPSVTKFNMSYEPPILFGNIGQVPSNRQQSFVA